MGLVHVKTINSMGEPNPNIVMGPSGLGSINPNFNVLGSMGIPAQPTVASGGGFSFDWNNLINRGFDLGTMFLRQNPPAGTYQQNTPYGSTIVRAQDGQPISFTAAQGGLNTNVGASMFGNMGMGTVAMIIGGIVLLVVLMKK